MKWLAALLILMSVVTALAQTAPGLGRMVPGDACQLVFVCPYSGGGGGGGGGGGSGACTGSIDLSTGCPQPMLGGVS